MNSNLKKIFLLSFTMFSCSLNSISNTLSFFLVDNKCLPYINKYNKLQNEKKKMTEQYANDKINNSLSDERKQYLENRISDLSFEIDNTHQDWIKCNGGVLK